MTSDCGVTCDSLRSSSGRRRRDGRAPLKIRLRLVRSCRKRKESSHIPRAIQAKFDGCSKGTAPLGAPAAHERHLLTGAQWKRRPWLSATKGVAFPAASTSLVQHDRWVAGGLGVVLGCLLGRWVRAEDRAIGAGVPRYRV